MGFGIFSVFLCAFLRATLWLNLDLFSVRRSDGAFCGLWFAAYFFYPKPLKGLSLRAWGDVVRCNFFVSLFLVFFVKIFVLFVVKILLLSVRGSDGAFCGGWLAAGEEGVRLIPGFLPSARDPPGAINIFPLRGRSSCLRAFVFKSSLDSQGLSVGGFQLLLCWWLDFGFWPMGFGIFSVFLCAFLRATLWLNLDPRCLRPQGVPIARESLISAPNNRSVIPIRQWPDRVPSVHHTSSSRAECNGAWRSVCWPAPSL